MVERIPVLPGGQHVEGGQQLLELLHRTGQIFPHADQPEPQTLGPVEQPLGLVARRGDLLGELGLHLDLAFELVQRRARPEQLQLPPELVAEIP